MPKKIIFETLKRLRNDNFLSNGAVEDLAITSSNCTILPFYHVLNLLTLILDKISNIKLHEKEAIHNEAILRV